MSKFGRPNRRTGPEPRTPTPNHETGPEPPRPQHLPRHEDRLSGRHRFLIVNRRTSGTLARNPDPIDRIREAEIKADLFALAGDAMRGREGGTLDEMTASVWVAERARAAGLQPAGDNGTYFQFFPLERFRVSAEQLGHARRQDAAHGPRRRDRRHRARQRRCAGRSSLPSRTRWPTLPMPQGQGRSSSATRRRRAAGRRRAAAGRRTRAQALRTWLRGIQKRSSPPAPGGDRRARAGRREAISGSAWRSRSRAAPTRSIPTARRSSACRRAACRCSTCASPRSAAPLAADARLVASIFTDSFTYPSVNVIAKVPGRDPKLRDEYVLFSAHQDHDGERYPVNGDNIWNGADDNATTAVALLAIGRAMAAQPARRSALFIWHGAEERGLMGSRWYVKHPTVPLKSIVAVPQRRHDRPQRSEDGGAARRAAAAPQLTGARRDGAGREHGGVAAS